MTTSKPAMFKPLILLFSILCILPASAQIGEKLRERIANLRQSTTAAPGGEELSYGTDPLQKLDYWKPTTPGSPLVIYVHGGGWKRGDKGMAVGEKGAHFLQQGYAFASVNYRLVPANTVEQQAQDVADAIAYLIKHAEKLGFDSKRVALMGHSAGAHLVALVGTDLSYLKKAELAGSALRGVIPLDGAAYDVPRQIAEGGDFMHDTYLQAFGTDPERQKKLSPTAQAAAPNAPAFLILHVQREDGTAQSIALGEALRKADTPAEVKGFEGRGLKGHMEINRDLGKPDYPATPVVDAWLKKILAP
jgi:arylformamidase